MSDNSLLETLGDKMHKLTLSRRAMLGGIVGLGASTLLAACGSKPAAPAANGANAGSGGAAPEGGKLTRPTGLTKDATKTKPLTFNAWAFRPDIVQDNVKRFEGAYGETVNYETVPGDYPAIMENKHMVGAPLDMQYANPSQAVRWYLAGWVENFQDYWDVEKARQDMYPAVQDALTYKGALLGLPYFNSVRGTIVTNELILKKAGLEGKYPQTWEELYAQLPEIKKSGAADAPFLPHWFSAWFGIPWGFVMECLNRGEPLFDNEFNVVFGPNSKAAQVLEDWVKLWKDKLVPQSVLTMTETDFIDAFAKGTYAYSPQQSYDLKTFNDPSRSQIAGHALAVPYTKQPWGVLDMGMYLVPKRKRDPKDRARAFQLAEFMGYKDNQGKTFVASRWAIESALNSGFQQVLQDPEVKAAYKKWMPKADLLDTIQKLHEKVPFPKFWHAFWYEEWNALAKQELPQAIMGQKPVKDVLTTLRDAGLKMKERYKQQQ